MLVLTRNEGESVVIGGVVIHVIRIKGNRVRIGIEAPPEMQIARGELLEETMDDRDRDRDRDQPGSAERNGTMPDGDRDKEAG